VDPGGGSTGVDPGGGSTGVDPAVPTLEPGVTLLRCPGPRSTALHRVVLATLAETDGLAYWLDARNVASTYALYGLAESSRRLRRLRIARVFTAYQHHALGRRIVDRVDARTGLLVAPNVASLYRDTDVPRYQRERLLDSTVRTLAALAEAREITTVLSVPTGEDPGPAADRAAREIRCERTDLGYRFEGPDVETTVYWQEGYWQTTISYWVNLFGTATGGIRGDVRCDARGGSESGDFAGGPVQTTLAAGPERGDS